ncbi:hypothetical protein [Pantoea sp. Mhis]|nr:hypothetical protein [Pantoea sp. Mhis]
MNVITDYSESITDYSKSITDYSGRFTDYSGHNYMLNPCRMRLR